MTEPEKTRLDALEARLTGPKKIALFGHRNVGKTTLLAMLYREAAGGNVPGVRLAAADAQSAEYLAEKIAQIESGQPMAGTLAETELHLRLYHGPARFDIVVKDYQGEHVTLGSDEPIQEFFAGCDAVLFCLDPEGSASPAERRRRQQEVENLLERYIERSEDLSTDRPVALLLTKFDRVIAEEVDGRDTDEAPALAGPFVERIVDERYGMTRHALRQHAPDSAIFAVSAYGPGSTGNRPPALLRPMGLEGPLAWLAERIEERDRAQMEWLWEIAPKDVPRLERCVAAYERRYPRSNRSYEFRGRLKGLSKRRGRGRLLRIAAIVAGIVLVAAGYDFWGYRRAEAFERQAGNSPPSIARRWTELVAAHPSLPFFFPALARQAELRKAEWAVKAADTQVAVGTAPADLERHLEGIKEQAPQLAPAIRKVEEAREQSRHEVRWKDVRAGALSLAAIDEPEGPLAELDAFLREFPDTAHRAEVMELAKTLKDQVAARRTAVERRLVDDLARSESLPNASFPDLIEKARQFLADHPDSSYQGEVQAKLDGYVKKLDERDIERARDYSRRYPTNFATRIERFQDYLKSHQAGGLYLGEAMEARDRILREWDGHAYRQAYDHAAAHPDDVAEIARRLRDYVRDHPDGQYVADAKSYLEWWDKISIPGEYRVTLRRGEVEPTVGKYFSGGAPDLGVVLDVGGVTYGPSSVIRDSHRPIWDYTFPRPIVWKLGDPITIRIIDYDWSASEIYNLNSPHGDPLAMRLLSGTVRPSKGGATMLVFTSDFDIPTLPRPSE
ncbi:GTPase domain-containing protein [Aquisphaera insulae]|uniref:GTPase domain-containing protein n=1 Tax=Aquisphaera insulae TaxID=2712864 RepID=UPI0013ED37A1|nr:GTPase domain-containing protein [Aquisphaera insulae]